MSIWDRITTGLEGSLTEEEAFDPAKEEVDLREDVIMVRKEILMTPPDTMDQANEAGPTEEEMATLEVEGRKEMVLNRKKITETKRKNKVRIRPH